MRKLLFLGLMIMLLASCSKDSPSSINNPVEKTNYFPLQVGNYWVYKQYDIDSLGNETETNITDSITISRDTIIHGNRFFVLEGTNYPLKGGAWGIVDILRDSSGYIVNENGEIKLSADNFTDTLVSKVETSNDDTLYTLTCKMERLSNPVTVPAGTFVACNFKGTVTLPQQFSGIKNPRYLNNLYSNNVGRILKTYFFLYGSIISEKRLERYNIVKK